MRSKKAVPNRRTRVELPTIEEAIAAAQGLTSDVTEQAQLAASLIGVPEEHVWPVLRSKPRAAPSEVRRPAGRTAVVIVERRGRRAQQGRLGGS